jgi:starch synthase (maltosyl-transferring)
VGERVVVEADIFTDGHDAMACVLNTARKINRWSEVAFAPLVNDRWRAEFMVTELGRYRYTISAWVDHFKSWRQDLAKRVQAEDIAVALLGARPIEEAITRAPPRCRTA